MRWIAPLCVAVILGCAGSAEALRPEAVTPRWLACSAASSKARMRRINRYSSSRRITARPCGGSACGLPGARHGSNGGEGHAMKF